MSPSPASTELKLIGDEKDVRNEYVEPQITDYTFPKGCFLLSVFQSLAPRVSVL